MKVLILSGRFGMGHNSAAKAITEELYKIDKNIDVNIVDLIEYMYPSISDLIYKSFSKVVNKYPEIYNMIYKTSEKVEMDTKLSGSKINQKISILLNMYKPDVIISTIPICARTISAYKSLKKIDVLLVTCITDISKHTEWIKPDTDIYLVPTREIKESIIESGIDKEKIFVVGIPIKPEFKNNNSVNEIEGEKNILIMGGGLGLLPDLDDIMYKLENIENMTTTIITGTNKKAYNEFQGKYKNTEIVGFTDRVSEYMAKADIIISKAGGITLFESIYSEVPMFVINPFLAQEITNAEFIEKNSIGKIIWNKKDFSDLLLDLIYNESKLKEMKNNMKYIKEIIIEDDISEVLKYIKSGVENSGIQRAV